MRPILDTHQSERGRFWTGRFWNSDSGHARIQSWTAILDGQRFWTHTNRTPIGTGPQSERPILDTHQSEPDVIQEVIQGSNSE